MLGFGLARDFLTNEKAPYIVTLFVAAAAWTVVRTTDRLASVPFVEYTVGSEAVTGKQPRLAIRLRNVTAASRFDCFELSVVKRDGQRLEFGEAGNQTVRVRGTVATLVKFIKSDRDEWGVIVTNMSPGADLTLGIPVKTQLADERPAVLVSACPGAMANSGDRGERSNKESPKSAPQAMPPILLESSITTFFVAYELVLLWSGLAGWLLLLLPYTRSERTKVRSPLVAPSMEKTYDSHGTLD